MPAPRNCRSCGAALRASVGWCGRCFTPVTQLAPREPVHRGDFVDRALRPDDRASRWARSATTFGPVGRVLWTVFVVGGLLWGLFNVFFVSWFCLLGIGVVILRDVWARARVVEGSAPADGDGRQAPAAIRPRQDVDRTPLPRGVVVFRAALAAVALAALLTFVYGDNQTKAAITMAGTLIGTYAFFRGFLA